MSEHAPDPGAYPHVVRLVSETAWAIEPQVLAEIREMVAMRAAGHRFTAEEIEARIGGGPARRDMQMVGSVAVIPIHGVIVPRADLMTEISGGTSVQRLSSTLDEAVSDKKVSAVVFDVSSPGGSTDMLTELAAEIRSARTKKPIVAVANTKAGSAAYWLASQADEFMVTPSGFVGSIGVFAAHEDISGALEKIGVKTTLVSAGKHKTEGNPFEPLSDEAREAIQTRIDDMYGMFTADVAKGRRVPVADVRSGFGEGRMLNAKQALAAGMVDGIATLQATVDRVASGGGRIKPDEAPALELVDDGDEASVSETAEFAAHYVGGHAAPFSTFTSEAIDLHERAVALAERLSSLAEVKRGSLTAAKRDSVSACPEALREVAAQIEGVLTATDPNHSRDELASLHARAIAAGHI